MKRAAHKVVDKTQPWSSKPKLPAWRSGTDRQIGRSLWRYMKAKGWLPGELKRVRGELRSMTSLIELLSTEFVAPSIGRLKISRREIKVSLETVFRLTESLDFVAAGATYRLFRERLLKEVKQDETRRRRSNGAEKSRAARKIKSLNRQIAVFDALLKNPQQSSEAIARRTKTPPSTVRRILRVLKKN